MDRVWFITVRTSQVSHTVGHPSYFLPALNPCAYAKSIEIEWPTSLAEGERPGGNEFGCQ